MKKNHTLALILLLIACGIKVYGAWLERVPQTLKQPDGSVLYCLATGDEYFNWLHDQAGYTIIQDPESGFFVYASSSGKELVPTGLIPGRNDPAAAGLHPFLTPDPDKAWEKRARHEAVHALQSLKSSANIGTINNIVLFVRFSDQPELYQLLSYYSSAFNGTGTASLFEYFKETSSSQLSIHTGFFPQTGSATVVSFQDDHPRSYYMKYNATTNPNGYQTDEEVATREMTLLKKATESVLGQIEATGLDYDFDDNGNIDNITYVVQGSVEGWNDLLWPHKWSLYLYDVRISGARVWNYNLQLSNSFGVSVLCHEMFHSLGAPDLYNYDSNGMTPVGQWDLMASNTTPPQHMSAWMKYKYGGWSEPLPEITEDGNYSLASLSDSPNAAYRIRSPYSATEFFIVEYRKSEGRFESGLPGSGLIITRINGSLNGNAAGPPNEVYVFRPGGTPSADGTIRQAFFSSESGRTIFGSGTNPSCFLSNGTTGGITISSISSASNTISFHVSRDIRFEFNPPGNLSATVIHNSVSLHWDLPKSGIPIRTGFRIYRNSVQIYSGSEPDLQDYRDPDLAEGSYSYTISALYTSPQGESERSNSAKVNIDNPLPDLVTKNLTVQPDPILSGEVLSIQFWVQNQGSVPSGSTQVRGLISRDQTPDGSDQEMFTVSIPSLAMDQNYPISQTYTLPRRTSDEEWYVILVTDPDHWVTEQNEDNNVTTAPIMVRRSYPDGEPVGIKANPTCLPGSQLSVTVVLQNNGPGNLGQMENHLLLSNWDAGDDDAMELILFNSPELTPGESYQVTLLPVIPESTPSGNYLLILETDYPDLQPEHNEQNNSISQELEILDSSGKEDVTPLGIIRAYPNPFKDWLTLERITADHSTVSIRMETLSGQVCFEVKEVPANGKISLPTTRLNPGIYRLVLKNRSGCQSITLIKGE